MDLRQLEMFRAVAGNSSFTLAAGQLHVAQSTISRKIRILEEELGEKLFRRALEANPRDAVAANLMGELQVSEGLDRDAREWFQRAMEARRDYAPAINNLASVYARSGQPNDAIAALCECLLHSHAERRLTDFAGIRGTHRRHHVGKIYSGFQRVDYAARKVRRIQPILEWSEPKVGDGRGRHREIRRLPPERQSDIGARYHEIGRSRR